MLRPCSSSNAAEDFSTDDALPSLHQIHQKQSVQAWRNIRQEWLKISIETEAMPVTNNAMLV